MLTWPVIIFASADNKMIAGAIHPLDTASAFTREAWCELVASRSEFRRHEPVPRRNPFTGGTMLIRTRPDNAEVVIDGQIVGSVSWSMSDEPLVNVRVEPSAFYLVSEWAVAMCGEFRPYPSEATGGVDF